MPTGTLKQKREKRTYKFPGEEVAEPLAHWLRGPGKQEWSKWRDEFVRRFNVGFSGGADSNERARTRIVHLMTDLHEVGRVFDLMRGGRGPTPDDLIRLRSAAEAANQKLRRYTSHPVISVNEPVFYAKQKQWRSMHGDTGPFVWGSRGKGAELQEGWALWAVQELSRRGLLDRVRRCDVCMKWFFAKKHFSLYCGADCRDKRYRHSPAYREWRSRRMNGKDRDAGNRRPQ